MATAKQLVEIAKKEIGYTENSGVYKEYDSTGDPWCAYFVSWCLKEAGINDYGTQGAAAAFAYMSEKEGKGTFHAKGNGYSPKTGDLFIRNYVGQKGVNGNEHVGIVRTDAANGSFSSVEGNFSDSVASNTRNVSDYCYVTPPFNGLNSSKPLLNLRTWSDIVTADKLNEIFRGGLANQGELFCEICIAYQLNPAFAASIACFESSYGDYGPAERNYNFFGYMSGSGSMTFTKFDSLEHGLTKCISNISCNYLYQGLNFKQIQEKYCPVGAANDPYGTNNQWYGGVSAVYKNLTGGDVASADLGSGVESDSEGQDNLAKMRSGDYSMDGSDSGDNSDSSSIPITSAQTMSYIGASVDFRENPLNSKKMLKQNNIELYISGAEGVIYKPVVVDEITWETEAYGSPAQLEFTIIKDAYISFEEGDQVIFKYKGAPAFYGFIFQKQRTKQHHIKVTAYDQTRYFKNSDCFVFEGCTATEIVKSICNDYKIAYGQLEDTGIKLPLTVCDNVQVFQIIENALDYTVAQGGYRFLLWDNFGSLVLAPKFWYKKNYVVCDFTAQDFDYTTTINEGTYTRVKLYYDNDQTGTREVYIRDKSAEYPKFGVLQYCSTLDEGEDGVKKAEEIIKITTNKIRKLDIKGALGDVTVRGGTQVYVELNLGDIIQKKWMECFSAKHTFKNGEHFMDLHLVGGQFI